MDDKLFALWGQNRQKGKNKFIFSYGFTATLLGLLVLLLAKFFVEVSTSYAIIFIVILGLSGILLGLTVWNRYERLYQQRINDNSNSPS